MLGTLAQRVDKLAVVFIHGRRVATPNDPKLSDRSPEGARVSRAALGEGAAPAGLGGGAGAVTEPVEPELGAVTERQGFGSLQRMVRRFRWKLFMTSLSGESGRRF